MSAVTDRTEGAYRRALAWYPERWRRAHGEEVLGVLLDQADVAGRELPTAGERIDLALHGTRERLRAAGAAVPASVRDRAAAISLATGAMFALTTAVSIEWVPFGPPAEFLPAFTTFGPFGSPAIVLYGAWILAFVFAMVGLARTSRVTIALTIPLAIASRLAGDALDMWLRPSWTTLGAFILLALLALLGSPGRSQRGAGWLAIAAVIALGLFAIPIALRTGATALRDPLIFSWPTEGMIGWVPVLALAIAIVLRLVGQRGWSGAALLTALPWATIGLFGRRDTLDILETLSVVLLFAVGFFAMLGLLRVFGVRVDFRRMDPPARNRRLP